MKFGTLSVHAGASPDTATGSIMTPIYQTSTFVHNPPGTTKGYDYSRIKNPTRSALEEALALLENGHSGYAFSSGMAAIDAVMRILHPGDEVICANDVYGGTFRLFDKVYNTSGITIRFEDLKKTDITEYIKPETRMIWLESPSNPLLRVYDLEKICKIAQKHNLMVAVDNTFATPFIQQPLNLGAHFVIHSATKYLGGHSDVILGGVVVKDPAIANQIAFIQKTCGAVPGPQDCYLVLRGIKTLEIRMLRQCENAYRIAEFLWGHPVIQNVYYPGLKDHPDYSIVGRTMKYYGGMVSFTFSKDEKDLPFKFLKSLKIFSVAESLGGVESLAGHPASMSHASVPRKQRLATGIADNLIRLSVGIENADDLIEDLNNALNSIVQ